MTFTVKKTTFQELDPKIIYTAEIIENTVIVVLGKIFCTHW